MVGPANLVAHLDALRAAGRLDEAAEVAERVLLLAPSHVKADRVRAYVRGAPPEVEGAPGGLKVVPFAITRDLLPRALRDAIHLRLLELEPRFEPAAMVSGRDDDYRRALILPSCFDHLGAALTAAFLEHLRAAFTRALPVLGVQPFEARFDELHALAYPEGAFFATHRDTGPDNTRRITFVYQLHATPRPFEGGDLVLHDTWLYPGHAAPPPGAPAHGSTSTRLVAEDNRLVFFPSEMYHEVTRVTGNGPGLARARLALNGWVHGTRADGELRALAATPY